MVLNPEGPAKETYQEVKLPTSLSPHNGDDLLDMPLAQSLAVSQAEERRATTGPEGRRIIRCVFVRLVHPYL